MDLLLYLIARIAVTLIQKLPLTWVARLGRLGGEAAYWVDGRHRRVAQQNLELIFGTEKTAAERTAIARENFRRIGEVFASMIKTATMSDAEIQEILEFVGTLPQTAQTPAGQRQNLIMAGGHFGNFELATRVSAYLPGYRGVATYRGISLPRVNRLLYKLRTVSGNILVDRRAGVAPVTRALAEGGNILTLAADQYNRSSGVEVSFLGHLAWTTRAPVILARRYNCDLYAPVCFRVGLARWRVELGSSIPLNDENGPRSTADILQDMNNAFEKAVIRDPANWFWFHRRWRTKSHNA